MLELFLTTALFVFAGLTLVFMAYFFASEEVRRNLHKYGKYETKKWRYTAERKNNA